MSEEFKQQSKAFLLGFIIIIGVSVVSAWNGPASTALSGNTAAPIDISATPQGKGKTPASGTLLDIGGILASNALAVWGDTNIQGDVTLGKQATSTSATNRRLCVDSTGKIILCGQQNFAYTTPGNYTFTVPSGVNTIIVELYGGGGAGFSDFYTVSNSGQTANEDGTASSFVHSSDSSKANLIAYGGKTPTSATTGGNGGSYSTNGSQVVSAGTTNSSGPSGDSPTVPASRVYLCSVGSGTYAGFELWKGTAGTSGGAGGGTGAGAGGAGGTPMTTDGTSSNNNLTASFCSSGSLVNGLIGSNYYGYSKGYDSFRTLVSSTRYPSTGGSDGSGPGSGGGGAGGAAGVSAFDNYSNSQSMAAYNSGSDVNGLCNADNGSGTYNKKICSGEKGKPGGGAGGYIKAKLSVTPGESYNITVGSGGKSNGFGTYWFSSYSGNGGSIYTGVYSGKGAPGAVNITYN